MYSKRQGAVLDLPMPSCLPVALSLPDGAFTTAVQQHLREWFSGNLLRCVLSCNVLGMLRWCVVQEAVLEETANMRWGTFKSILADALVAHLQPIQQQYAAVMADETYLDEV